MNSGRPVTGIKGYTQLLERRMRNMGDATATAMFAKLDGQIDRLTGLIDDLLDVTRIESGELPFRPAPVRSQRTDRRDRRGDSAHDGSGMSSPRSSPRPITLVADRGRIGQVLTNLLSNAIKYSPQADRVVVRTAQNGERIVVSVQDFGIGIPMSMRPHVFERFFRVDGESRTSYAGLGLGLYIAAEFVKRHGGAIWVEGEEEAGTTVAFSLPLDGAPNAREGRPE